MVVVSDDDVFFSVMFYEKRSTDMKENFPPIGSTKNYVKNGAKKLQPHKNHEDEKSTKEIKRRIKRLISSKFNNFMCVVVFIIIIILL